MKYLVAKRKQQKKKAHLWDDGDTYCKMHSTGGLNKKKYEVADDIGDKEICLMCRVVFNQFNPDKPYELG